MPSAQSSGSFQGGGVAIQFNYLVAGDHFNTYEIPLLAALLGSLTTRTDANTGIVTVASGHGITTSDTVDIYDANGALIRKDVDVTAVSSTTISIDLGSGSDLPVVSTPVIVGKQVPFSPLIDGDKIQGIAINLEVPGGTKGRVDFVDAGPASVAELTLTAGRPIIADVAGGQANPLTGNPIVTAVVSHAGTAAGGTLKIISLEDSTP
jgi:hypothetical protein